MPHVLKIISSTLIERELYQEPDAESAGLDAMEACLARQDDDVQESVLEAIWGAFTPAIQRMLSSAFRAEMVACGEDIRRIEDEIGLRKGTLSSWCSGSSVDVPVGAVLGHLERPLLFLSRSYEEGIDPLMSWSEIQWEELHLSVSNALQPHSVSSLSRHVPLTQNVLKRIKSKLEPGDHFYEDFFTMKMLLDVYEEPCLEEERALHMSSDTGAPRMAERITSRVMTQLEELLCVLKAEALEEKDFTMVVSRGELHLWVGEIYVTRGEGMPPRPAL